MLQKEVARPMTTTNLISRAAAVLQSRTFVSFDELEAETGLTPNELIARKSEIEDALRAIDPSIRLTSRMDLDGFEIAA